MIACKASASVTTFTLGFPQQFRLCSTATSKKPVVLERKIILKNRPPINIVQTGYIAKDGSPSPTHTILLLSGIIGTAWSDFRPQLEGLPKLLPPNWSLVACDLPGRGKSKPPNAVMPPDAYERNAAAGFDVMEALGIEQYSVMGWSSGGVSAMQMAAQYPYNIKTLVLVAPVPFLTANIFDRFQLNSDPLKWPEIIIETYGAESISVADLVSDWPACIDGLKVIAKQRNGDVNSQILPMIKCPTLFIFGTKDLLIPLDLQKRMHDQISGSELHEIIGGGHNLQLCQADKFNQVVAEFLKRTIVN